MACIYILRCAPSGKIYVGQTRYPVQERFTAHVYYARHGGKTHLSSAIRLYGPDAFSVEILEECDISDLNEREIHYIATLSANNPHIGYNMSVGGDDGANFMSIEVRRKISLAHMGVSRGPMSASSKAKISAANTGKRRTLEQIARIRESRPYPPLSETHKMNISRSLRRSRKFALSKQDRIDIRELCLTGETDARIARLYAVSRKMVWRIRHNVNNCLEL